MKKSFFIVLVVLLCDISPVLSQDPIDPFIDDFNNQIEVDKNDTIKSSQSHKDRKRNQKVDSLLVYKDSVRFYKEDSVPALLATIINLQGELDKKNKQPVIPQSRVDSLKGEINKLDKIIKDKIIETFGQSLYSYGNAASNFFCYAVLESPFYTYYDDRRVTQSLDVAKAMGYDQPKSQYNDIYNIYYDLLVNYNVYTQELKDIINEIIKQFSYAPPNREFESKRFEDRLANSGYYKVRGKGKNAADRHIYYLDYQIENIRNLFKSDTDFKKGNFIAIREQL